MNTDEIKLNIILNTNWPKPSKEASASFQVIFQYWELSDKNFWFISRDVWKFSWCSKLEDCDVMTRFVASRYVNLEQRYVSTRVGAGSGGGGGSENNKNYTLRRMFWHLYALGIFSDESTGSFICLRRHIYMSYVNKVQPIRIKICDIYMCRLRHKWSGTFITKYGRYMFLFL
jgi:hypothetical protein